MTVHTTTAKLIREQQERVIELLSPEQSSGVKFRRYEGREKFDEYAELNPSACLRRYRIEDDHSYEPPESSDLYTSEEVTGFTVMVAYPVDGRFGRDGHDSIIDAIVSDRNEVDKAIGLNGPENYLDGQHSSILVRHEIDQREDVWLSYSDYEITFRRLLTEQPVSVVVVGQRVSESNDLRITEEDIQRIIEMSETRITELNLPRFTESNETRVSE